MTIYIRTVALSSPLVHATTGPMDGSANGASRAFYRRFQITCHVRDSSRPGKCRGLAKIFFQDWVPSFSIPLDGISKATPPRGCSLTPTFWGQTACHGGQTDATGGSDSF
jgi:hypothetical protein